MILGQCDTGVLSKKILQMGMRSLRHDGLLKVRSGLTSLAEVYRVTRDETVDMKSLLLGTPRPESDENG